VAKYKVLKSTWFFGFARQ